MGFEYYSHHYYTKEQFEKVVLEKLKLAMPNIKFEFDQDKLRCIFKNNNEAYFNSLSELSTIGHIIKHSHAIDVTDEFCSLICECIDHKWFNQLSFKDPVQQALYSIGYEVDLNNFGG
jgi:hypothetical protein